MSTLVSDSLVIPPTVVGRYALQPGAGSTPIDLRTTVLAVFIHALPDASVIR